MTKNISYHQGRMDAIAFIHNDNIRVGLNGKPKERYKYKGKCPPEKHWVQPEKGKGFCRKSQGLHSTEPIQIERTGKSHQNNWLGWAVAGIATVGLAGFLLSGNSSGRKGQSEEKAKQEEKEIKLTPEQEKKESHYEALNKKLNDGIEELEDEDEIDDLINGVIDDLPNLSKEQKEQVKGLSGEPKFIVCDFLSKGHKTRGTLLEADSENNMATIQFPYGQVSSYAEIADHFVQLDIEEMDDMGKVKGFEGGFHEVSFEVDGDTERDEEMSRKDGIKIMRGVQKMFTSTRKYIPENAILYTAAEGKDGHADSRINIYQAYNFQKVKGVKINSNHEEDEEGKVIPFYSPLLATVNRVKNKNKMEGLTEDTQQTLLNHLRTVAESINKAQDTIEIKFDAYCLRGSDNISSLNYNISKQIISQNNMQDYLLGEEDASAFIKRNTRSDRIDNKQFKNGQGKCPNGKYLVVPKDGRKSFCRTAKKGKVFMSGTEKVAIGKGAKIAMGVGIPLATLGVAGGSVAIALGTRKKEGEEKRLGSADNTEQGQNKKSKQQQNKTKSNNSSKEGWSHRGGISTDEAFNTLGVESNASVDEIKKAHRKLVKQYHPDLNPNDKEAEKNFKRINNAFEVIQMSIGQGKRLKRDSLGYQTGYYDLNLLFQF